MDYKKLIISVLTGLITAIGVDLHAYSDAPKGTPFDFQKAIPRWIFGALAGITAGSV